MRECRKTCIVINSDLPEIIQQIILIHEIGHALLHQKPPFRSSVFIILNYSMECHNVNMKRIALPLIIFWKMKMSWKCLTLICPFSRLPQN
ncbi:MAG: ImmA/IrrE family metallo-endopeptidase [Oscillospiraceae bacterium]|nr:MAG: ImmA/IrrE family metallo-endopeptidase [Oscillospiraceae bacterium]